jgi:DNA primase
LKTSLTEFTNKVRDAADVVEIIGSFVPLKKTGASFKGLCPFHKEKTPSFHVHPGKQVFHCFGCGVGGDIVKFWMMHERVNFRAALEQLAHRLGISVPRLTAQPQDEVQEKRRRDILTVSQFALEYFERLLNSAPGKAAREYLDKRSVPEPLRKKFHLGYAPDLWEDLIATARRRGYSTELLQNAGLALPGKKAGGFYDRFRGRIIFPILNLQGECVAFGGRTLGEGEPKYLNSPETEIYKKGKLLYGLNLAKDALRNEEPALIVEGYMDLIALHKFGFTTGVATLGTALTEDQARLLKRFTREILFIYDGDEAGQTAMIRGCEVLLGQSLGVKVVTLPEIEDPDTFLGKHGPEAFKQILEQRKDFLDFFLDVGRKKYNINTPEAKIRVLELFKPILGRVFQPILFDDYTRRLAEGLRLEQNLIARYIRSTGGSAKAAGEMLHEYISQNIPLVEKGLLKILLENPELRTQVLSHINREWISSPLVRKFLDLLLDAAQDETRAQISLSNLLEEATEDEGQFLREIIFYEIGDRASPELLSIVLNRLRMTYESSIRHTLVLEIQKLERGGNKEMDKVFSIADGIHDKSRKILETRRSLLKKIE